jgi:hypothetical protein
MPTTVMILRNLWRLRAAVVVVFIVAVLVGTLVGFRISLLPPSVQSRQYHVGVASARVLVDTPTSDLIDVAPKGSDTLAGRATLLANLMVDGVVEDEIAKRAGLHPDELIGVAGDAGSDPTAPKPGPRDHVLTTGVALDTSGDQLPIITIDTQAPDVAGAERLANAAIAGLNTYLDGQAAKQSVPEGRRLRVTGLGAAQAGLGNRGPSRTMTVVLVLLLFGLGCALLLAATALLHGLHAASVDELLDPYAQESELDEQTPLLLVPGVLEDDGVRNDGGDDRADDDWLASPSR